MTREERQEVKSRNHAGGFINANADLIYAALRATTLDGMLQAVSGALGKLKRSLWGLDSEVRQAVQEHVQTSLAASEYRLQTMDKLTLSIEKRRLEALLAMAKRHG